MLFLDEHLSQKLVSRLKDIYPGITQSLYAEMLGKLDNEVWEYAKSNNLHIVTKDSKDYKSISDKHGFPPKVIVLKVGNCKVLKIDMILRNNHKKIIEFLNNSTKPILEVR